MSHRRSSFPRPRFLAPFVALLGLALAPHAGASSTYPEALRGELGLAEIVDPPMGCLLCHKDLIGGLTTATKPFGRAVLKAGGTGASVPKLLSALQALEAAGTDSDFDGVGDIAELRTGTDPNVADVVTGAGGGEGKSPPPREEVPLPETGCSLTGAPARGQGWSALGVALLWFVRRRQRH